MKKLYIGIIIAVIFIAINTTNAQEKEKQLWYCFEEVVHPEHISEYWELSKELADLCKSEQTDFWFYAWTTGDFKYQYWHPINSLNDIDKIEEEWNKVLTNFGKNKVESWQKTIKSTHSRTITEYSALSIIPENPRVEQDSVNYMEFQEFYLKPGTQQEFKRIMKKAVDHLKSEGHNDVWRVASGDLGYDGPVFIGWSFDKSQTEYLKHDELFSKKHKEFFDELNKDFVKILRAIEKKDSWFLRDLSYFDN